MTTVQRKLTGIARYSSKLIGMVEKNKTISVPETVAKHLDKLSFIDALGNKVPYFTAVEETAKKVTRTVKEKAAKAAASRNRTRAPAPSVDEDDNADPENGEDEDDSEDE